MATDVSGPDSNVPLTNTLCQFSAMLSNRHYRVASNYDSETENGIWGKAWSKPVMVLMELSDGVTTKLYET